MLPHIVTSLQFISFCQKESLWFYAVQCSLNKYQNQSTRGTETQRTSFTVEHRVFLEQSILIHRVKNLPNFTRFEASSILVIRSHSEPAESSLYLHTLFLSIPFNIILPSLLVSSSLQVFRPRFCMRFLHPQSPSPGSNDPNSIWQIVTYKLWSL
jgi:hypothetical protein